VYEPTEMRLLKNGIKAVMSHDTDRINAWREIAEEYIRRIGLIGRMVTVRVCENRVATGRLICLGTDGQVVLLDESDGSVYNCWPLLEIQEVVDDEKAAVRSRGDTQSGTLEEGN
jgi:hypothetical protein